MASVTIHIDLGPKKWNLNCLHFSSIICHEGIGPDDMIFVFECWVLSQLFYSPLLFHPHQGALQFLFNFCHSVVRVEPSAYLRLWLFLPAILIPACDSYSLAFRVMYFPCKLNKQGDNVQLWRTPFPIWNQSVVPCPVLTVAFWPTYRFLKGQIRWSGIPISFRIFHSLLWSTQSKALA